MTQRQAKLFLHNTIVVLIDDTESSFFFFPFTSKEFSELQPQVLIILTIMVPLSLPNAILFREVTEAGHLLFYKVNQMINSSWQLVQRCRWCVVRLSVSETCHTPLNIFLRKISKKLSGLSLSCIQHPKLIQDQSLMYSQACKLMTNLQLVQQKHW